MADVACGTGHALVILARAFPASTFTGYDLDEHAIARARTEAAGAGLQTSTFEVLDVARVTVATPFDVVLVFDALHDQVDPAPCCPDPCALVREACFSCGNRTPPTRWPETCQPDGARLYSISTLHCLTVSLAHGGAGIGSAFGEQLARGMLTEPGSVRLCTRHRVIRSTRCTSPHPTLTQHADTGRPGHDPDATPALNAMSWPRLRTCNLASSDDTWVSTVRTDKNSAAAISALDFPSPSRQSTSASRRRLHGRPGWCPARARHRWSTSSASDLARL